MSIAGAVGVLVIAAILLMLRDHPTRSRLFVSVASLLLPLAIGMVLLGGYNYVRFENPLETGLRYQFTDNDYSNPANPMFSIWALPLNLYNYFGRHVSLLHAFPFLKPIEGKVTYNPLPFAIPTLYFAEPVTAIPLSAPFVGFLLGLGATIPAIRKKWLGDKSLGAKEGTARDFRFFSVVLLAAMLAVFLPLMFFWYAVERFVLDFLPLALILAACGAWKAWEYSKESGRHQIIITLGIAILAIWTSVVSVLLAVTGYGNHW